MRGSIQSDKDTTTAGWKADAEWLIREVNALQSVIGQVPVDDAIPGEQNIRQRLTVLLRLHSKCYLPLFRDLARGRKNRPETTDPKKQIDRISAEDEEQERQSDISTLLRDISSERQNLLDLAEKFTDSDWDKTIVVEDEEVPVKEYVHRITDLDRTVLKGIGELVMVFQKEQLSRRDLQRQRSMRPGGGEESEGDSDRNNE